MPTVRHDLPGEQWDAVDQGVLAAPDGRTYRRRTTRVKRRDAAALVASGCPVITHWPGGLPGRSRTVWHDGDDAISAWAGARGVVTSDTPHPRAGGAVVTVGRWESPDGATALVLTWHH